MPGAHRQNARPVLVGDQGRDQAQRGRRRVLQGRGGRAHGRTSARPSQGARPRCRPCSAVPCLARPRGVRVPLDQRAPQGPERVAGLGCHVLAPQQPMGARSATRRSTRGSTRHRRRGLVGARDRAAPGGGTRRSGTPVRRVVSPQVVGMRLTGRASRQLTTGWYRGTGRGRPDHRQEAGPALARPWSSAPPAASSWWAFPWAGGPTWCGRPHPPHPRTARRRDERPDLGTRGAKWPATSA